MLNSIPRVSRLLAASFAAAAILATSAWAQQAPMPTVRIRGTIDAVDGNLLSIKTREGTDVKVKTTDDLTVIGIAKSSLADIKESSYIGVSGMPLQRAAPSCARILILRA